MAGKSDFLENAILDHVLGNSAYTAPANIYVALFTSAPSDVGGDGTEVSGGSYARAAKTNNATNFPAASGGIKSNGTVITFAQATAPWGTVVAVGLFDASTGGNMLFWAPLLENITVPSSSTFSFSVGQLQFTED